MRIGFDAKRLFSNKQVLGRFAKACLPEFHDLPLETIIGECFDDDYSLQGKRRGASPAEFARGIGTEQILPQDDTLHLDLLFNAWIPGPDSKRQRQFINIEIQKDAKNLERLIGRGIIYNVDKCVDKLMVKTGRARCCPSFVMG